MIFRFLHPWFFAALALVVLVALAYLRLERRGRARIVFSDISPFKEAPPTARTRLRHLVITLRCLALAALIAALARPQYGNRTQEILSKGIDIILVIDTSTSMSQTDLEPDRLGAAKNVILNFIDGRERGMQNDRLGLVVFSRIAFTQCPLTVDYAILKEIVARATFTRKEFDGTAIGTAIATATARIKDSPAKSKVMILVTDGENNAGIDPMTAAAMAQALKIKIYTIGVVPAGFFQKVQDRIFGAHLIPSIPMVDETQMKQIASTTGGKYFRAADEEGLQKIFDEIDKMEKTEVKVKEFYRYSEAFSPWAAVALALVLAEALLGRTLLRRIP